MLRIFVYDRLSSYQNFYTENTSFVEQLSKFWREFTACRGGHTSGGWIRGSSLHTEVATLQGVGLEGVHCMQRWPHFRGLDY